MSTMSEPYGFDEAPVTERDRDELMALAAHVGLPWHIAPRYGAVVSDQPVAGGRNWEHGYNGWLIAESIPRGTPQIEYLVSAVNAVPWLCREVDRLQHATAELIALRDRLLSHIEWQETKAQKARDHSGGDDIANQAAMAKAAQIRQETATQLRAVLNPVKDEESEDVPF